MPGKSAQSDREVLERLTAELQSLRPDAHELELKNWRARVNATMADLFGPRNRLTLDLRNVTFAPDFGQGRSRALALLRAASSRAAAPPKSKPEPAAVEPSVPEWHDTTTELTEAGATAGTTGSVSNDDITLSSGTPPAIPDESADTASGLPGTAPPAPPDQPDATAPPARRRAPAKLDSISGAALLAWPDATAGLLKTSATAGTASVVNDDASARSSEKTDPDAPLLMIAEPGTAADISLPGTAEPTATRRETILRRFVRKRGPSGPSSAIPDAPADSPADEVLEEPAEAPVEPEPASAGPTEPPAEPVPDTDAEPASDADTPPPELAATAQPVEPNATVGPHAPAEPPEPAANVGPPRTAGPLRVAESARTAGPPRTTVPAVPKREEIVREFDTSWTVPAISYGPTRPHHEASRRPKRGLKRPLTATMVIILLGLAVGLAVWLMWFGGMSTLFGEESTTTTNGNLSLLSIISPSANAKIIDAVDDPRLAYIVDIVRAGIVQLKPNEAGEVSFLPAVPVRRGEFLVWLGRVYPIPAGSGVVPDTFYYDLDASLRKKAIDAYQNRIVVDWPEENQSTAFNAADPILARDVEAWTARMIIRLLPAGALQTALGITEADAIALRTRISSLKQEELATVVEGFELPPEGGWANRESISRSEAAEFLMKLQAVFDRYL